MSLVTNLDNIYKGADIGKVRKAQEDSHGMELKTPNGDVFVVCDGMGGHVGGAKASSLAVDSILSYLKKEKYANPIDALNGALQFANMQILGFASANPEFKGMGTTACIVLMQGNDVWIAHVGDSRIYLYLGNEKDLHRITKDHSYVQTLVDAGEITDDEAEHHPNKNRILKALGIKPELQPTFNYNNQPIHPKNGDVFLICSDGLSGMIPDSTIEKVLAQNNKNIEEKGNMLIQLAKQGETVVPGGQDNCTVELVCVDNSPWQKSEFKSYNPAKPNKKHTTEVTKGNGGEGKGKKKGDKAKLIIIVLVALAVLGAGGFYICRYKVDEKVVEDKTKDYTTYLEDIKNKDYQIKTNSDSVTKNNFKNSIDSLWQKFDSTAFKENLENDFSISERQRVKCMEKYREIYNNAKKIVENQNSNN